MPSTIPASRIVTVVPGVIGSGGNAIVLNGLMLTHDASIPMGAVVPFASAAAVAAWFGATSPEARLAAIYFKGFDNATKLPGQLYFAQYNAAAVAAYTRGGSVSSLTLAELQALSGVLTVTFDGESETSSNINLAAATSFSDAAAKIQAAFASPAFSVSYDSQRAAFVFTGNDVTGEGTVDYISGTLAAGLMLTKATGAVVSQGAPAAVPGALMDSVVKVTMNWGGFMPVFEPMIADKLAFAVWNNNQAKRFAYIQFDTDVTATQANNTTSFGVQVQAAAYDGVVPVYNTPDVAAFMLGTMAAIDFTRHEGRITFAFKSQSGLAATVTDAGTAANLDANGYNYYGAYANSTNNWNFLYSGLVSGKYKFFDEYVNQIWLNAQLQTSLVELLVSMNSIPYDVKGYALIEAACVDPINAAVDFGAIRAGVALSAEQIAKVNNDAGVEIDTILSSRGWYLQISPATAQVRGQRQSPPMTLWYMDGGSVQQVTLASIVVQ